MDSIFLLRGGGFMSGEAKVRPGTGTVEKSAQDLTYAGFVVLKEGKAGLRFGPVVTGQVALGKDGCGY